LNVADTLAEITAWAEPATGGWRYLFSTAYRAQKRTDWRHEHVGYMILDILGGIIGVGVTLAIAVFLVMAISSLVPN